MCFLCFPETREEIRTIGHALANYMHKNDIRRVMFLDRSARPAYMALRGAWHEKYFREKLPEIYFTHPDAHNTEDHFPSKIDSAFARQYPYLVRDKKSPLLVFDNCMHKGQAMGAVTDTLARQGFKKVKIGLVQPRDSEYDCRLRPDFVALDDESLLGCYPFLEKSVVDKPSGPWKGVLSRVNPDAEERKEARQVRELIYSSFGQRRPRAIVIRI